MSVIDSCQNMEGGWVYAVKGNEDAERKKIGSGCTFDIIQQAQAGEDEIYGAMVTGAKMHPPMIKRNF